MVDESRHKCEYVEPFREEVDEHALSDEGLRNHPSAFEISDSEHRKPYRFKYIEHPEVCCVVHRSQQDVVCTYASQ